MAGWLHRGQKTSEAGQYVLTDEYIWVTFV